MSGGISASTATMIALTAASTAMTVVGGLAQSSAQRAAGDAALQDARDRQEQLNAQARARDTQATQVEAAKQREAIEAKRKGELLASRARAVMAASGGGVDESILAGLMAEGEYGKDVALYEGAEAGRQLRHQGELDRYSGTVGVQRGQQTRDSYNRMADWTVVSTLGKAGISIAEKYGGSLFSGSSVPAHGRGGDGSAGPQRDWTWDVV